MTTTTDHADRTSERPEIDGTSSAPTPGRRSSRPAQVVVLLVAVLASLFVGAPGASAVTVQESYGLSAEAPYAHRDIIGRKWIYGAGSTSSTAYATVRVTLYQWYGGRWNAVGYNEGSGSFVRVISRVLCTGAHTNYYFYTNAQVKHGAYWYGKNSSVVVRSC